MKVTRVDERTVTQEFPVARFRVHDWLGEDVPAGSLTAIVAYDIDDSTIWEALDWLRQRREPQPALSELFSLTTNASGSLVAAFLGSVTWHPGAGGTMTAAEGCIRVGADPDATIQVEAEGAG